MISADMISLIRQFRRGLQRGDTRVLLQSLCCGKKVSGNCLRPHFVSACINSFGMFPPLAARFSSRVLCNQMFISAESPSLLAGHPSSVASPLRVEPQELQ